MEVRLSRPCGSAPARVARSSEWACRSVTWSRSEYPSSWAFRTARAYWSRPACRSESKCWSRNRRERPSGREPNEAARRRRCLQRRGNTRRRRRRRGRRRSDETGSAGPRTLATSRESLSKLDEPRGLDRRVGEKTSVEVGLDRLVERQNHHRFAASLEAAHLHRRDVDVARAEQRADLADDAGLVSVVDKEQVPAVQNDVYPILIDPHEVSFAVDRRAGELVNEAIARVDAE